MDLPLPPRPTMDQRSICGYRIGLSLANFYETNQTELLNGTLKMPGVAFDLANSLDQLLIAIPFLILISGNLMGNDYSQRTNQHWLMRAPAIPVCWQNSLC